MDDYFIAVHTYADKSYCDARFFNRLVMISDEAHVVDSSCEDWYFDRLNRVAWFADVERLVCNDNYLECITRCFNWLREKFLKTNKNAFVMLESDVLVPRHLLSLFEEVRGRADIIGGIYYRGFHEDRWFSPVYKRLVRVGHVLPGCALYERKVLEQFGFRYDIERDENALPDAWISKDAGEAGFKLANYTKIKCDRMEADYVNSNGGL